MAYVPPHLRRKGQDNSTDSSLDSHLTIDDINHHFWPKLKENEGVGANSKVRTSQASKTLHDSADRPGKLAYIFLFWEANPKWESEHIIFTKSSLELLPKGTGDADNAAPIAVFKQASKNEKNRGFEFVDWFFVERVDLLEPNSAELVQMLESKWQRVEDGGATYTPDRRGKDWEQSLGYRWAVVKMVKEADAKRGPPKIEQAPKLSVNELLAQSRLKGQSKD